MINILGRRDSRLTQWNRSLHKTQVQRKHNFICTQTLAFLSPDNKRNSCILRHMHPYAQVTTLPSYSRQIKYRRKKIFARARVG